MWLFTETGFISAVRHRHDKNLVVVRARDKMSLQPLADLANIDPSFTPVADYAWRVIVPDTVLKEYMDLAIETMEYDNFKNQVSKTRGRNFVGALHDVWETMHKVEDERAKTRYNMTRHEEELAYAEMERNSY